MITSLLPDMKGDAMVKKLTPIIMLLPFCLALLIAASAFAQESSDCSFEEIDAKIDIIAINAILISRSPDVIRIFVTMSNQCRKKIVISGRLKVIINPDNRPVDKYPSFKGIINALDEDEREMLNTRLVLGETNDIHLDLNACEASESKVDCVKPGETLCQIEIPYKSHRVVSKLVNYLGFPGSDKTMHLQGGLKILAIGKQKIDRVKHQVDFKIKPRIKSEVLFRKAF